MSWFKKKPDPISDRARQLNEEIARLEAQIQQLGARPQGGQDQPRLRSTALPQGDTAAHAASPPPSRAPAAHEPIFEQVGRASLKPGTEVATTPAHFNELGVRKYDLPALARRIRHFFHGPSTTNPKLVSYLAAGGIQGLRPLRYEKRVARRRFIALTVMLFFILLWIIAMFIHRR